MLMQNNCSENSQEVLLSGSPSLHLPPSHVAELHWEIDPKIVTSCFRRVPRFVSGSDTAALFVSLTRRHGWIQKGNYRHSANERTRVRFLFHIHSQHGLSLICHPVDAAAWTEQKAYCLFKEADWQSDSYNSWHLLKKCRILVTVSFWSL